MIASAAGLACTVLEFAALPPVPLHVIEYFMVPTDCGVTLCEPLVAFAPDQSLWLGVAEAMHAVAFVLDHVTVITDPIITELTESKMLAVGAGGRSLPPQELSATIAIRLAKLSTA